MKSITNRSRVRLGTALANIIKLRQDFLLVLLELLYSILENMQTDE